MLAEDMSLFFAEASRKMKLAEKLTKMERKGEEMENLKERKWWRTNEQRCFND